QFVHADFHERIDENLSSGTSTIGEGCMIAVAVAVKQLISQNTAIGAINRLPAHQNAFHHCLPLHSSNLSAMFSETSVLESHLKNKITMAAGTAGAHHALVPNADYEVGPSER